MFNMVQLDFLLDEIDTTEVENPAEREALDRFRAAAQTAISKRGYLYLSGD
jgi:hypothetical protein